MNANYSIFPMAALALLTASGCEDRSGTLYVPEPLPISSSSSSSTSSSSSSSSSTSSSGGQEAPVAGCASSAAVCADFDGSDTLPSGWSLDVGGTGGGTVALTADDEPVFSGDRSLKVVNPGGGYNRATLNFPIPSGSPLADSHYGMMMVYISDENEGSEDFTLLELRGPAREGLTSETAGTVPEGTNVNLRARIDGTENFDHLFANYDTWVGDNDWPTDCWNQPDDYTSEAGPAAEYIPPKNKWVCLQWHVERDTNTHTFWLEGEELGQISMSGTDARGEGCGGNAQDGEWLSPSAYTQVGIGIESYADNGPQRTVYFDDVALDEQLIACPGNPAPSVE